VSRLVENHFDWREREAQTSTAHCLADCGRITWRTLPDGKTAANPSNHLTCENGQNVGDEVSAAP
jgi:hypothetical protein